MENQIKKTLIIIVSSIAVIIFGIMAIDIVFWQRYNDQLYNFSIDVPRMWQKQKGLYLTALTVFAPFDEKKDKFRPNFNIVVKQLPVHLPASTVFQLNKEELLSTVEDVQNFREGVIYAGLMPGSWLSFEATIRASKVKVLSAIWSKGKNTYTITFTAEIKTFSRYEPTFQRIMKSLRVK